MSLEDLSPRERWGRLEELLRIRRGALSAGDLLDLLRLYRSAVADLAQARLRRAPRETVAYLNGLAARAHLVIYASPPGARRRPWRFLTHALPSAFRRNARFVLASAILLFGPALLAFAGARADPRLAYWIVPPEFTDALEEVGGDPYAPQAQGAGLGALATSFYVTNNTQVAIFAFALGIFLGLGTAYVLAFNGLMLGAVSAAAVGSPWGGSFWGFVAAHAGVELLAIVISGAAGLRLGWAIVAPRHLSRARALQEASRDLATLVVGAALLLGVAALVEANISPQPLPFALKAAVGVLLASAALAYFLGVGRRPATETAAP